MIYAFQCQVCGTELAVGSQAFQVPPAPTCCEVVAQRIYGCNINTSACRDASDIPPEKRVVRSGLIRGKGTLDPVREEQRFYKHIQERRKVLAGNQKGSIRHTHSVPADLYHGKIRETGDKLYWNDPANVDRHKDCKVS